MDASKATSLEEDTKGTAVCTGVETMKDHVGKNLSSTVASCGVAAPTGDATCVTDRLSGTDPTVALSHGDGVALLGAACTAKDSDIKTEGCDASTTEDTSDLGSMSKHSTKNSCLCCLVLSETVVPSAKDALG